jgi:filamentous hemagglutinin family protein
MNFYITQFNAFALYCAVAMWCSVYASTAVRAEEMLPSGYQVVSGQATFQQQGNRLDINASSHAVINYQRFDIGQSNQVNIHSPVSLHRVVSNQPSQILGQLNSTGHVFLVNQNGIVFGKDAQVNVGSLTASTLDANTSKFSEGQLSFEQRGGLQSHIRQQGTLNATNQVNLISGGAIENSGRVQAQGIHLSVGQKVSMQVNDHVSADITVDEGIQSTSDALQGITNSGTLQANQVKLQTRLQQAALKQTVNNTGVIEATGFDSKIAIDADGTATLSGRLSANNSHGKGGNIELGADALQLTGATLTADGETGGGQIRVGGEYLGGAGLPQNELRNATTLNVDEASTLSASSTGATGHGGKLILWADGDTHVAGQLSARGGSQQGQGGFIETSGKHHLNIADTIRINTHGVDGAGTWLLDPENIIVANSGGTITPATIIAALGSSNVTLNTYNPGMGESGNINVNDDVVYNSSNALNILAMGNILFNQSVRNTGTGDINMVSGWDGATGLNTGNFNMASIFATPSSYGNSNGSVTIADTNLVGSPIAVGSANGKTQVAASSLFINGGNNTAQAGVNSQLGYTVGNSTGDINVYLKNQLALTGGSTSQGSARIGHGANYGNTTHSGNIFINGAQSVLLQAGNGVRSEAKIGHGGFNGSGTFTGTIDLLNVGNVQLITGGTTYNDGHSQIGHAGANANASATGNIRIESTGDVTLRNIYAVANIGHGTYDATGTKTGDISVSAQNITLDGKAGLYTETRIGHSGGLSSGNVVGNITLNATDQIKLLSGNTTGVGNRLNIGHGVLNGSHPTTGNRQGNISMTSGGELSLVTGASSNSTIGHSTTSGTVSNTNVLIKANSLDYADDAPDATSFTINSLLANNLNQAQAGGHVQVESTQGSLSLIAGWVNNTSPYNVSLISAGGITMDAPLTLNGGGTVTLDADGDITLNSDVLSAATTGPAITAVSRSGNLLNNAGASGLYASNSFWLAYSGDNLSTTTTGLSFNSLYQHTYVANPPSSLGVGGNTVLYRLAQQFPPPPPPPPVVVTQAAVKPITSPEARIYTLNQNQNAGLFVTGTVGQWSQLSIPIAKPALSLPLTIQHPVVLNTVPQGGDMATPIPLVVPSPPKAIDSTAASPMRGPMVQPVDEGASPPLPEAHADSNL